jgi:hypothetical protein
MPTNKENVLNSSDPFDSLILVTSGSNELIKTVQYFALLN